MSETVAEKVEKVDNREECLKELNVVLQKYNFSLVPTFQLVEVKPEVKEETSEEDEELDPGAEEVTEEND